MRLMRFLHVCKRDFPEFMEWVYSAEGQQSSTPWVYSAEGQQSSIPMFITMMHMIEDFKCPHIASDMLTLTEHNYLWRRYTIEMLQEHKELVYFRLLL